MDFSENIAIKTKSEVQEPHFSGKQYALHCNIVQPNEVKFVYHLSDDTTHDPSFVQQVLEDIFDRWEIRDETIVVKSDNAPTQYKNKWAFESYSSLAKKYNVRIIRIYGAAGRGKGVIDAMSSFGVKSFLKRDIIGLDVWFGDSRDICEYLDMRKEPRMSYSVIDQAALDRKRMEKKARKIDGCTVKHLFDYKPGESQIYETEFLYDCDSCLDFRFEDSLRKETPLEESMLNESETSNVTTDDCYLDDFNEDRGQHVFEFVSITSFVAVVSYNLCEPVYIIKVTEKNLAKEELKGRFGHIIYPGELYLKGNYLKLTRSKNIARKKFTLLPGDVVCEPDEVFDFVDVDYDLTICKDAYLELISRSS